jgi:hypothetical protein
MRERRQVPRYVSELKARLVPPATAVGVDVKIATLSIRGSCIEGVRSLKQGQRCELKIEWDSKELRTQAEVVWLDDKDRAGLRFLSVDQANAALLKEICSTLKLQPIQPPQPLPSVKRKTRYE